LYLGGYIEDYKLIRRCVNGLYETGLIEILPRKKAFQHNKRPCRLTINGIFYLVMERRIMGQHIYNGIFKNYGSNILFDSCLYPYLSQYTVTNLTEINAISAVCLFLYECCKAIEHAIESINTTKYKHAMRQVCIWERVTKDQNHTANLTEFLKEKFDLKWLDKATFEKINDNNTVRTSYRSNSVLITLNKTRTKAVMEVKGDKKQLGYEFIVEPGPNDALIIVALDNPSNLLRHSMHQVL